MGISTESFGVNVQEGTPEGALDRIL